MEPHRLAEVRSIRYHGRVAELLRDEPAVLARARQRVVRWRGDARVHPHYVEQWNDLLAAPVDVLCQALMRDDEHMRALRQVSPFAGALPARERWALWREVRTTAEWPDDAH